MQVKRHLPCDHFDSNTTSSASGTPTGITPGKGILKTNYDKPTSKKKVNFKSPGELEQIRIFNAITDQFGLAISKGRSLSSKSRDCCLFCGLSCPMSGSIECCETDCHFRIHDRCFKWLDCLNNDNLDKHNFCCKNVTHQISMKELQKFILEDRTNGNIAVTRSVKSKLKLTASKMRRRRYNEDLTYCRFCKNHNDLYESNHLELHCPELGNDYNTVLKLPTFLACIDEDNDWFTKRIVKMSRYARCNFLVK